MRCDETTVQNDGTSVKTHDVKMCTEEPSVCPHGVSGLTDGTSVRIYEITPCVEETSVRTDGVIIMTVVVKATILQITMPGKYN